jgi:hypothetical protein
MAWACRQSRQITTIRVPVPNLVGADVRRAHQLNTLYLGASARRTGGVSGRIPNNARPVGPIPSRSGPSDISRGPAENFGRNEGDDS